MVQQRTATNEQPEERVECPSCLLRLSLLQAQVEKVEKLLYCIKDTLNFKEACRYTGLSDSQLYKLTKTGKVPHYKPSGKLLFFSKLLCLFSDTAFFLSQTRNSIFFCVM